MFWSAGAISSAGLSYLWGFSLKSGLLWKGAATPAAPRAAQWPPKGGRVVHAPFKSHGCAVNDSFAVH